MTGAHIVRLLGATANKDLPGYNKDVMGQGLLDLEAATRPYGVVGIPTTGRGGVIPLSGAFSTNSSGGLSAINSKLSSVMVTDEFNRDYYVNMAQTANKNLPGYNEDVMGQGLLDLEAATRPYGVVGIPTTGRGGVIPLSGAFSTNTSGGLSAISSKLSSVMVTDEFNRDYYVNMAQTANAKMARADFHPISKASFYEDYNPYNRLNFYTNNGKAAFGEYDVKMNMNEFQQTAMVEMGKSAKLNAKTKMRMGFGTMNERSSWMGNNISGALGQVSGSLTQFMNFSGVYNLDKNFSVFGSAWIGYTNANMETTGLITNVGATETYSWNMGLDYTREQHSLGATLSQPVTVRRGTVDVSIPVGWTADGQVAYDRSTVSIRPTTYEYDVGLYYKYKTPTMSLVTYGEHHINYLNQPGVTNNLFGMAIAKEF